MRTGILLFFYFASTLCFAQDSSFKLKDYKYRTPGYRSLEFSTSLNGNSSNNKQSGADAYKDNFFQLAPSWITYQKFFSTDRKTHISSISFAPVFYSHTSGNDQEKSKGKNAQGSIDWQFDDRFYKNSNWFWQLGNHLHVRGDFTKQVQPSYKNNTNVYGADESLSVGFGKGRIESVQDAQMALFILNDLKEQGLITAMPDAATINQFARLITELNNRRVFDYRRKRIYQLTQIDAFLREKGITPSTDIRHFTIIDDNWTLAFNPGRSSGADWFFTINPSAQIGTDNQTMADASSKTIYNNDYYTLGLGPKFGYENYKPLSLKWQRNMGASLSWQTTKTKQSVKHTFNSSSTSNDSTSQPSKIEFYAFYSIGFYPNNRTALTTDVTMRASELRLHDDNGTKQIDLLPGFHFAADYFISYRTRLQANFYINYTYDHLSADSFAPITNRRFQTGFSVGISHLFL